MQFSVQAEHTDLVHISRLNWDFVYSFNEKARSSNQGNQGELDTNLIHIVLGTWQGK